LSPKEQTETVFPGRYTTVYLRRGKAVEKREKSVISRVPTSKLLFLFSL